jgi:hypothetical protein
MTQDEILGYLYLLKCTFAFGIANPGPCPGTFSAVLSELNLEPPVLTQTLEVLTFQR